MEMKTARVMTRVYRQIRIRKSTAFQGYGEAGAETPGQKEDREPACR
jgi:hypothetical protein